MLTPVTGPLIAIMACGAEYIDSTLGMGYGTTLTPLLLLLFGIDPKLAVPAVLLSELVTGFGAGVCHHAAGNVCFGTERIERIRRPTAHTLTAIVLGITGMIGVVAAVVLAVKLPSAHLNGGIGIIIVLIGGFILLTRHRQMRFTWGRVATLGVVAAFNKGLSGGGYGPLITGGQLLAGVESRSAIGITSLAEGLVCAAGLVAFFSMGGSMPWALALCLTLGAVLSTPLSALSVRRIDPARFRSLLGILAALLGVGMVTKAWLG